ncbi:Xaa-Pro aminopeptidase [Aquicella lusitana]|uniref:Xaa-Pro aminopeptidase n=1 Tax=Aquicella lusitana TaxID=254246 RepID=A0A370GSN2_9COXI|nr:Xaa-Pro aminopeptidase [Aquicella lusitana]RDI46501.1 aminopeptidase P [Aquicella lusitana]VVC74165.1 Xaa-Pro aminopeptidase [Aquicella lusitana]
MIKMSEYAKRRKELIQTIGPTGIAILPAAPEVPRNGDAVYPYRQNSDFYYLTGFEEPEAVVILAPKRKEGEYLLFNRVRDRDREIWDGPRAGQEGAVNDFLADQAFPISELESMLPELLAGRESIHYSLGLNKHFDKLLLNAVNNIRARIRSGLQAPIAFIDIAPSLHEMRLFKSAAEIAVMQKAVDITEKAHLRAMEVCEPGMYEYQLEAELMYAFIRNGARFPAYNPIVGAGRNTCILHYVNNNQKIADGDMVLIDAGAEYQNYAADVTRTFPANGRFSAEQRAIYELVLDAQMAAIKAVKPGAAWTAPQNVIVKIITQGLIDLGILKGNLDDLIEKQAYFPFYMHRSGHWLGLDVHDVGCYRVNKKWRPFEPGMVLTVEPGIYISADIPGVPKRWHNIGVRIEDNVVVTEKGRDVLSQRIPKTVADIEAVMKK